MFGLSLPKKMFWLKKKSSLKFTEYLIGNSDHQTLLLKGNPLMCCH